MTNKAQFHNYSIHCANEWKEHAYHIPSNERNNVVRLMVALKDILVSVPKFHLEDGGRPIEDRGSIARLFDNLHIPFPCVALEYKCHGDMGENQAKTSKRISLVWDLRHGVPAFLQALSHIPGQKRDSLLVQSIFYVDEIESWLLVAGQVEICVGEGIRKTTVNDISPEYYELMKHKRSIANAGERSNLDSYPIMVYISSEELIERYGLDKAIALIQADSGDEVLSAISFAALTSCSNVSFSAFDASPALNKKRINNGKIPFDKVHVLMVENGGYVANGCSKPCGGSHASPRTHLRRGHIRQLDKKVVWVNAAVVNSINGNSGLRQYSVVSKK